MDLLRTSFSPKVHLECVALRRTLYQLKIVLQASAAELAESNPTP